MKKVLAIVLSVLLMFSVVTACTPKENDDEKPGTEKKRIALLTAQAGTQVFILEMIAGMNEGAELYDFEAIIAESGDNAAFEDNARALIQEGVDLIIGGGWESGEVLDKIAVEFPDACDYALIDSEIEAENVKCISYREQEGAYLIGVIAGMVADEGEDIFGSVHVNQGAGSWKWRYGYMEGVKTKYPEAEFIFNYVGSYSDPAKAKEFALQQYEQGASFVNSACAGGDPGIFEAALEKGFYTSGQDTDLTTPDNEYIVSSQIKDTRATVLYLLEQYFSGEEWTTDNEVWGLAEGTIGAVHATHESKNPRTEKLSDEDVAELKEIVEDIRTGKLDLANMPEEEDYE